MPKWIAAFLAVSFLFAGCAANRQPTAPLTGVDTAADAGQALRWLKMVGRWYGQATTAEGEFREHIAERYADGTYRVQFRVHKRDGSMEDSMEVGRWGVSGPIYFTFFAGWVENGELVPADPGDPFNYNAYIIDSFNGETMKYHSVPQGNHYTIRRVARDFEMPGPRR